VIGQIIRAWTVLTLARKTARPLLTVEMRCRERRRFTAWFDHIIASHRGQCTLSSCQVLNFLDFCASHSTKTLILFIHEISISHTSFSTVRFIQSHVFSMESILHYSSSAISKFRFRHYRPFRFGSKNRWVVGSTSITFMSIQFFTF
jgi:hypothetical protein